MESVSRHIGRRLHEAGVRYVFGHPGGEVTDLMEGFRAAGLEFVLTHHECAAAFMADAIGHFTGVPGVCLGTLGPGATNLVTGVAHAWLDRAPVIAFTAQLPADRYPICTHQKLDLLGVYGPITKLAATVTAANADALTVKAVRTAVQERPGPVYLQVAPDVAGQPMQIGVDRGYPKEIAARGPDPAALQEAADRFRRARRPLLLAGLDAMRGGAAEPLRQLAEAFTVPVMVGPKAKGVFPENHPLFVGTIEMLGTQKLYDFIDTCDLVVMAGFDPVELDRDWPAKAEIINFGPVINEEQYYPSIIDVVAPVGQALEAFLAALGSREAKWNAAEITAFYQEFRQYTSPAVPGLAPQRILAILRDLMPADGLVTCDVGNNKSVTGQHWQALQPYTFFMSNGLSSMGYGLPSAMGLKLVAPDRAVATVLGDGGFAMMMGELETIARLGLKGLAIIVLEDNLLAMIRNTQLRKGIPDTGTRFGHTDYVLLAKSAGLHGVRVQNEQDCRDALRAALSSDTTTVIAAQINEAACRL